MQRGDARMHQSETPRAERSDPTDSQTGSSSQSARESPESRQVALATRDEEVLERNKTALGTLTDLALIQDIPGTKIEVTAQANQRLRVTRNGIRYGLNERRGPTGPYVYAVGADLGDGIEFPVGRTNCFGSLHEGLHALRECILWDPRQSDIPAHHRASHIQVTVQLPGATDRESTDDVESAT